MKGFSDQQNNAIQIVQSTSAFLSFCACLFMARKILKEKKENLTNKMLTVLFGIDFVLSIFYGVGRAGMQNGQFCRVQGLMVTWFGLAAMLWVALITFQMNQWIVRSVRPKKIERQVKYYIPIIFGLTGCISFGLLIGNSYGHAYLWCWVRSDQPMARFWLFDIFLIGTWLFMVGCVAKVTLSINQRNRRQSPLDTRIELLFNNPSPVQKKLLLFVRMFVIVWIFALVNRLIEVVADETVYVTSLLEALFLPLQGLFNMLCYGGYMDWMISDVKTEAVDRSSKKMKMANENDSTIDMSGTIMLKQIEVEPNRAHIVTEHSAASLNTEHGYVPKQYSIFTTTFNLGEAPLQETLNNLKDWILIGHDIYAVGVQECVDLSGLQLSILEHLGGASQYAMFSTCIGSDKTQLGFHGFIGLTVYIKQSELSTGLVFPTEMALGTAATGIDMIVTTIENKGAVGIAVQLYDTNIGFVTCHLPSDSKGKSKLSKRNAGAHAMLRELSLVPENVGFDAHLQHDHLIVSGDMNYRMKQTEAGAGLGALNGVAVAALVEKSVMNDDPNWIDRKYNLLRHSSDPLAAGEEDRILLQEARVAATGAWSSVLRADELRQILEDGDAFCGFDEPLPRFPPSYKRKVGVIDGDCGDYTDPLVTIAGYSNTGESEELLQSLRRAQVLRQEEHQQEQNDQQQQQHKAAQQNTGLEAADRIATQTAEAADAAAATVDSKSRPVSTESTGTASNSNNNTSRDMTDQSLTPPNNRLSRKRGITLKDLNSVANVQSLQEKERARTVSGGSAAAAAGNGGGDGANTEDPPNSSMGQQSSSTTTTPSRSPVSRQCGNTLRGITIASQQADALAAIAAAADAEDESRDKLTTGESKSSSKSKILKVDESGEETKKHSEEADEVVVNPNLAVNFNIDNSKVGDGDDEDDEQTNDRPSEWDIYGGKRKRRQAAVQQNVNVPEHNAPVSKINAKKLRPPSYTDRILTHSLKDREERLTCVAYDMCDNMRVSDHRPVTMIHTLEVNSSVLYRSASKITTAPTIALPPEPSFGLYQLSITEVVPNIVHPLMPLDELDFDEYSDEDYDDSDIQSMDDWNVGGVSGDASAAAGAMDGGGGGGGGEGGGTELSNMEGVAVSSPGDDSSSLGRPSNMSDASSGSGSGSVSGMRRSGSSGKIASSPRLHKPGEWRKKVIEEELSLREQKELSAKKSLKKKLHIKKKKKKSDDWTIHHITIVFPIPSKDPLLSHRKLYDFAQVYKFDAGASDDIEANSRNSVTMSPLHGSGSSRRFVATLGDGSVVSANDLLKPKSSYLWPVHNDYGVIRPSSKRLSQPLSAASIAAAAAKAHVTTTASVGGGGGGGGGGGASRVNSFRSNTSEHPDAAIASNAIFRVTGCVSPQLGAHAMLKFSNKSGYDLGSCVVSISGLMSDDANVVMSATLTNIPLSSGGQTRGSFSARFSLRFLPSVISGEEK